MVIASRPFCCCGTHRSWLLGITIFLIVANILAIVGNIIYLASSVAMTKTSHAVAPELRSNLRTLVILLGVQILLSFILLGAMFLPLCAERKNNPRLLVYFRYFLYCLIALAVLIQITGMALRSIGIPQGIGFMFYSIFFNGFLIMLANRRYAELVDSS